MYVYLKLSIFHKNRNFVVVKNTLTHALSILTRCDINFLENAWEINRGFTWRNELVGCFRQCSESHRARSRFLVSNRCTYCLNYKVDLHLSLSLFICGNWWWSASVFLVCTVHSFSVYNVDWRSFLAPYMQFILSVPKWACLQSNCNNNFFHY